jgi:lipid II:glycine glycyltransferase (peptidoglycan interpeptide bridge formation enzyme)
MYAVETPVAFGLRNIELAPWGFYASPGWAGRLEQSTLKRIMNQLTGLRTRHLFWNVRFDQEPLAAGLAALGLKAERSSTHVLRLHRDHEQVFAGYNATMRNQVRQARRRGVQVRAAHSLEDLRAYYQIHLRLVEQKGGYSFLFPVELLQALLQAPDTARFLVAEYEERIVAGGFFLRDGCSVFYLHGASDREYSHAFPTCAVIDEAIRWACEGGVASFNFGGSGGIASLEKFKSFWGARSELNWHFHWVNPFWQRLWRLWTRVRNELTAPLGILPRVGRKIRKLLNG